MRLAIGYGRKPLGVPRTAAIIIANEPNRGSMCDQAAFQASENQSHPLHLKSPRELQSIITCASIL